MEVKIPSFNLNLKTIWIIVGVVWHLLFGGAVWYIGHRISQYEIDHKIEEAQKTVGGIDKTLQDRIKVNDARFENLEKITNETRVDVGKIQVGQESMTNQMNHISAMLAALVAKNSTAEQKTPLVNSAVYEVP